MIIKPKTRGFICTTAHPDGCAVNVREQIEYVRGRLPLARKPKNALIIGASTGYGLSSRIAAAFAGGAGTLGVFFERPGSEKSPASAGWYNSVAVKEAALAEGLYAKSINGDAFSRKLKQETIETIRHDLGQVDLIVYSLASPRRTDPKTGEIFRSVLKPIGAPYSALNLNTDKKVLQEITLESATDAEIAHTVKVMGGEDWELWMDALLKADVVAPDATTVAYSYIGPEVTWPIYTHGTIGRAKLDLDRAAAAIGARLKAGPGGRACVSVNKALVTQASSAIPVVPLYISLLYKIMKEKDIHEGCIEQIQRLYADHLFSGEQPTVDASGRIRIDDWEMRGDVQAEIKDLWRKVSNENLEEISDFAGYQKEFLKLFGFGCAGVDYEADTEPVREFPG